MVCGLAGVQQVTKVPFKHKLFEYGRAPQGNLLFDQVNALQNSELTSATTLQPPILHWNTKRVRSLLSLGNVWIISGSGLNLNSIFFVVSKNFKIGETEIRLSWAMLGFVLVKLVVKHYIKIKVFTGSIVGV